MKTINIAQKSIMQNATAFGVRGEAKAGSYQHSLFIIAVAFCNTKAGTPQD